MSAKIKHTVFPTWIITWISSMDSEHLEIVSAYIWRKKQDEIVTQLKRFCSLMKKITDIALLKC